jgi:hypothetical protein
MGTNQRSKFALALNYLNPLTFILAAMSYTLANAISGDYPDYELSFGSVLISRGSLTPATNGAATIVGGSVRVAWNDNSGVGTAKATDKALIAVINADKGEAVTVSAGESRSVAFQNVSVPADWVGEDIQVYLGFISEDSKEVANSVYLGTLTVA